jgi:hypothetical protein
MMPKTAKNKRRDSRRRYKGHPYGNKKWIRQQAAKKSRRIGAMTNDEYQKCYDVWWTLW